VKPLSVVHVISNLGTGGAEAMLARLVAAGDAREVSHTVVAMLSGGVNAERIRSAGGRVVELGARRSLSAAKILPRIAGVFREAGADVVQGWMYHGNVAASAASLLVRPRPPVLWNVRQTVFRLADNRPMTQAVILAGTLLRASPAGIVYNARLSAEQHEGLGFARRKRILIPNGFDLGRYAPREEARPSLLAELGLAEEALLIGRAARLHPQKDDATLFAAFGRIAAAEPRAHLVLPGSGMTAENAGLARLAKATGAKGRVHFLGERGDLPEIMAGFDLALSSSAFGEAFSNAIGEAMAAGVPAVSTDVGEAGEIIGETARIAPIGDAAALAEAALKVLSIPQPERLALGARDRERIAGDFSIEKIASLYLELWRGTARRQG